MSQDLLRLGYTAEDLAAIDEALNVLDSKLIGLIGLTPEERRQLTKMGEKSEAFCRHAVTVLTENSQVLARNFDLPAYQADLAALDALRPRATRVQRLQERLSDSLMALGSDLMVASLEGYAHLKVAGQGEGLDALKQTLGSRFKRGPRDRDEEPTAA